MVIRADASSYRRDENRHGRPVWRTVRSSGDVWTCGPYRWHTGFLPQLHTHTHTHTHAASACQPDTAGYRDTWWRIVCGKKSNHRKLFAVISATAWNFIEKLIALWYWYLQWLTLSGKVVDISVRSSSDFCPLVCTRLHSNTKFFFLKKKKIWTA